MNERKLISIVTPCYNEEDNVEACYQAVRDLFDNELSAYDFEHIFCDNASTDDTESRLRDLAGRDKRVRVILNSRNYGAFPSLFNGILATKGDAVLLFLPADLQDPPELIPEFVRRWEEGYEVVYGIRKNREESFPLRSIRKIYYRIVNRLSEITLPLDVGEFQLVDRKVAQALRQFNDYFPYLRGIVASCGFKRIGIEYTWKKRERGKSKVNLYGLLEIGINGIISFSKVPLRLCVFLGFLLSGASILYALGSLLVMVVHKILYDTPIAPKGIPTIIVGMSLLFGIQLFFLGVLGEYIGAIHSQVRKGPLVIERERLNFD